MSPYSSSTRPQQQQPAAASAEPSSSSPPRHIPVPGARNRVTSLMHRGADAAQTFTSPLAQIFQPLVVDDGGIPEDSVPTVQHNSTPVPSSGPAPPPAGVSYGPAYRRRLSSVHVQPGHAQGQSGHSHGQFGHRRPSSEGPRMLFPTGAGADDPFSGSPDDRSASLPTAEDVEEKKDVEWMQRLEKMEARQERIEGLLERIARDLQK